MGQGKRVSVWQRRVSAELRMLRIAAGLTCLDVAKALDCSESKISRMETGDRGLYADDVSAILGFLRVPAASLRAAGRCATPTKRHGQDATWRLVTRKPGDRAPYSRLLGTPT